MVPLDCCADELRLLCEVKESAIASIFVDTAFRRVRIVGAVRGKRGFGRSLLPSFGDLKFFDGLPRDRHLDSVGPIHGRQATRMLKSCFELTIERRTSSDFNIRQGGLGCSCCVGHNGLDIVY
jgi:hypothetical protein